MMPMKATTSEAVGVPKAPAEHQIADLRALLNLGPDADIVLEVRKLQDDWRHRGAVLASQLAMIETCMRMLRKSLG